MTNRFSGRWNRGQASVGAIMYELLLSTPLATATLAVVVFMRHLSRHSSQPLWCPVQGPQQILSHSRSFGNKSTTDLKDSTHISEKIFCPKGSAEIIGWPEDKDKCRKVLIATLEYEIFDGNLKVEIVKDTEHPAGEPGEPIEVVIFGEPYLIEVETHAFDNITYVLLDSPISTPRRNHTRIPLAWMISVQQPFIRRGIRPSQPPLVGPRDRRLPYQRLPRLARSYLPLAQSRPFRLSTSAKTTARNAFSLGTRLTYYTLARRRRILATTASRTMATTIMHRKGRSVATGSRQEFGDFLEKANKATAQEQRNIPDPLLQVETPQKLFVLHSRAASSESLGTLAEEKVNSPLNKAVNSVHLSLIECVALQTLIMILNKVYRLRRRGRARICAKNSRR
ncbi:hypothetical protein JVT61DRAFT_12581 [Boletus reticuloceps]|uniref:Uncharacterized protein n=1 Tax=Boletus reticuloceps TaxID=495285 RepID=A0A8I2YDM9_9AGAM|nr:hypothetical protein JVT61DRAFT_12581 [Boletus reticuloceps]